MLESLPYAVAALVASVLAYRLGLRWLDERALVAESASVAALKQMLIEEHDILVDRLQTLEQRVAKIGLQANQLAMNSGMQQHDA